MKSHLVKMLTLANKLIIDHPHALAFVEDNRAAMNNRVPIMLGYYLVRVFIRLPLQHTRLRFVADHKRRVQIGRVLFETVDLRRRMIRSRSKLMSLLKIAGINVSAGI